MSGVRKYWRVAVLVILVTASAMLVFGVMPIVSDDAPSSNADVAEESSATTLNFGLELAGGTRIRAPLTGVTAESVTVQNGTDASALERDVASHLDDIAATDVTVRPRYSDGRGQGAIEVTADNVTTDDLASALDAEDIEYGDVRAGVTSETRAETVRVINDKINHAGLSGGTAREVTSGEDHFVLIEVPDQRRGELVDLLNQRGSVRVDLYYPTRENGTTTYTTETALLEQGDFQRVNVPADTEELGPHVPVALHDDAAQRFEDATIRSGMARGGSACRYDTSPNETGACLLTLVDGEVVYSAGMSPGLATTIENGEWVKDPTFVLQTTNYSEAQDLSLHLRAGALPASLDIESGTSTYVSPTQGDHFKTSSIIIGLLAIFAVSLKVLYRYRDIRVAGPMVLTALSEVVILFGVASLLGYPIDLAVIGGFIAVIGTGIDDLIIIANEVLQKGDVNSERVFQSRFKKAFWIIGAAALTAIIAMSPLMVLSLGDLRGFAIFTIIGVIIGVVITRPAYGDILQHLILD